MEVREIDTGEYLTHVFRADLTNDGGRIYWACACLCGNLFALESIAPDIFYKPCPKCAPGKTRKISIQLAEPGESDTPIIISRR